MKTTVDLPDELLTEARRKAAAQGRSLRALFEEGLRMVLQMPDKKPVRLITVKGGLPPDLDLSSRDALYEWFDKNK